MIINPEILIGNENMENLWKKTSVRKRLLNFIFDEGHCISQWGAFRKEYQHLGSLRYLIPEHVPFYIPSATLPPLVLLDIAEVLHLRTEQREYIMRSNDRPEICLVVRSLAFAAKSFQDLNFLIPDKFKEGDPPPINSSYSLMIVKKLREHVSICEHDSLQAFETKSAGSIL